MRRAGGEMERCGVVESQFLNKIATVMSFGNREQRQGPDVAASKSFFEKVINESDIQNKV